MISSIKYVDNYNDIKFKEEVLNYYNEVYNKHILFTARTYIDMLYYAKYLIEKNNMNYSSILQGNIDEWSNLVYKGYKEFGLINRMIIKRDFVDNKFYTLLKYIAFQDYELPLTLSGEAGLHQLTYQEYQDSYSGRMCRAYQ